MFPRLLAVAVLCAAALLTSCQSPAFITGNTTEPQSLPSLNDAEYSDVPTYPGDPRTREPKDQK